jgi:hypothetical protein
MKEAVMAGTVSDRGQSGRSWETSAAITYAGAAAFGAASIWYALAVEGVTVASEPQFTGDESPARRYRIFYGWVVSTLPQERWYVALAIVGFVSLAAVGLLTIRATGPDARLSRTSALTLALGSSLWIVGNLVQLGGHRAVGLMATHGNPLPTVGSIFFTIEMIDDAFETAAFATIGLALLLARANRQAGERAWSRYTAALGGLCLTLAFAYIRDEGDLVNLLLVTLGTTLLPLWLIWTGARLRGAPVATGRAAVPAAPSPREP